MRRNIEEQHQRAVIQWWSYAWKGFGVAEHALFHVPTGGLRHKSTAGRLKAMGTRRGIPDLLLPIARGGFAGMAIEMKSENGRETDAQKIVLRWFREQCWRVEVAYTSDAAIGAIKDYLIA